MVWDPIVRITHWGVVLLFFANFTLIDDDSPAHIYAGYALLALVVLRIVWGLVGSKYARFSAFWPTPRRILAHIKGIIKDQPGVYLSHNPLGALMVLNLLVTMIAISVTGIMLTMRAFRFEDWVEDLHEGLAIYALVCVGIHVAGVLFEMKRSKINLIKAMVTGKKQIHEATT
jgi:cytochrome b